LIIDVYFDINLHDVQNITYIVFTKHIMFVDSSFSFTLNELKIFLVFKT
jgi:hypothetical protein